MSKVVWLVSGMMFFIPEMAWAHPSHTWVNAYGAGFWHPFSGLDHLLMMIAVGVWAAMLGGVYRLLIPLLFLLAAMVGFFVGVENISQVFVAVEVSIALSLLFIGVLIFFRSQFSFLVSLPLMFIFGLSHGIAHGVEVPMGTTAPLFLVGFMTATALLHGIGMLLSNANRDARWLHQMWGIFLMVAGAWEMML
ncbi:MAG: HupE/UreJ family protein [Zetaproteobacteria bacterium]|nr:HupE/UreJ family protein [Zetaproteobacteria bacterium]